MPSKKSMKKNSADQKGANGIMLNARGYATNAKPGPKTPSFMYKYMYTVTGKKQPP